MYKLLFNKTNFNAFRLSQGLSYNPYAISYLEQHDDDIEWGALSSNPNAIHILEKNLDKVDWRNLSRNHRAIELLEQNQDKIDWDKLVYNNSILVYDYDAMKQATSIFYEELIQKVLHPRRLLYYLENYDYDIGEDFV
ncbi:hypothetical protein 162300058 [Organic Lake phycodnavirus 2]|nr:hypothetical protein 162300058 [Organic Lake phycodnavirus 2]